MKPVMLKGSKTILVVDDEVIIRELIASVLEIEGYHVLTAADGREALQIILSGTNIDLIITDLRMPYDGIKLVKTLKEKLKTPIPFIMMSGENSKYLAESCMKWQGAGYFAKPFKMSVLRDTVEKASKSWTMN
jgi:two-component system phosphate regulon response regulator PhoB